MPVVDHLLGVLTFSLFAVAPLPLCFVVVARAAESRGQRLPQAVLVLLASWCVLQALVAHALALLHLLRLPGMVAAELLLLCAGWLVFLRLSRRRSGGWSIHRSEPPRQDALESLLLLGLAFLGAFLLWSCAARPVVDYDSWAFHMPHMAQWLQTGSLTRMAQEAERARNSYPYGWELLCTLFLTPFGEDLLVTFPNLVAWALLGTATYLFARLWRAERVHALAAATLLLAIPCIAETVNTMHVDMPFAALFVAGTYFGALFVLSGGAVALGLAATMLGLSCAVRTTAPFYAVFAAGWLTLFWLTTRRGEPRRRDLRGLAVAGIALGAALAVFWYAKNLIEIGTLLGSGTPYEGPEADPRTFAYLAAHTLIFAFQPLSFGHWQALAKRATPDLGVPFLALAAMAALWPLAALTRRRAERAPSSLPLVVLLFATLALLWITPLSAVSGVQVRLGMPLLAALAVVGAVAATRAHLPAVVSVALALICVIRAAGNSRVLYGVVPALILWVLWRARRRALEWTAPRLAALASIAVVALTLVTAVARIRRERERVSLYGPAYVYLEEHVAPGEPVAYLQSARPYVVYGRRLAREVVYTPLHDDQATEAWAEEIRRRNMRFVAFGPYYDDAAGRALAARLCAADGPLEVVAGNGSPGGMSLGKLK